MRVALVHDYLTQTGGAERVALALTRMFPGAPLYTTVYDRAGTFPGFADIDIRPTFLQRLPHSGAAARALLPLYPAAVESLRLSGYDLVVSSSSGWAHGTTVRGGLHVSYCYTPARWLYQTPAYVTSRPARAALGPLLAGLRAWDRRASARPAAIVTMTPHLADRIERTWGRSALVVPPPVDLGRIRPGPSDEEGPFFLVVSRLLDYKRVDLAISACARLGVRLVVVGQGPARDALGAHARRLGADVTFRQRVPDDVLNGLLHACTALVQAGEEDFGLGPLEANAAGRPAVVLARGGALATTVPDTTGVTFDGSDPDVLAAALARAADHDWRPEVLRAHAATFSEGAFRDRFGAVLRSLGLPFSHQA